MPNIERLGSAAGHASVAAGPLFLVLAMLLGLAENAGQPMAVSPLQILPFLALLLLSVVVGTIVAFPLCLVAGVVVTAIADALPLARSMALWQMAAAAIAVAILHSTFGFSLGSLSLAFTLAAVACATIVRSHLHWD